MDLAPLHASDYVSSGGTNSGGGASGGFGFSQSDSASHTLDIQGNYLVTDGGYTVNGTSQDYHGSGNDGTSYSDGGGNTSPSASAGYGDFSSRTASSMVSMTGTFTNDNGALSDQGTDATTQSSSYSYSSSASGGGSVPQVSSSASVNVAIGDGNRSYTSAGTYANSPGQSSAGGSFSLTDTSHASASGSSGSTYGASPTGGGASQSASSSTSSGYIESGTYSVANGVSSVQGPYTSNTVTLYGGGSQWNQSDPTSNSSQTQTASTSYGETGSISSGARSGSFSSNNSTSSSYTTGYTNGAIPPGYFVSLSTANSDGWATGVYSDSGSFSQDASGGSPSRSTSFSSTNNSGDESSTLNQGVQNALGGAMGSSRSTSQSSRETATQTGYRVEAGGGSGNSASTSFSDSVSATATMSQGTDGGNRGQGGSFEMGQWAKTSNIDTKNGSTVSSGNTAATSSGTFTDDDIALAGDSQLTTGGLYSSSTDYSSSSFHDSGTFTNGGGTSGGGTAESRSGSYTSRQIALSTVSTSQSAAFSGDQTGGSKDTRFGIGMVSGSASGTLTSTSGVLTQTGDIGSFKLTINTTNHSLTKNFGGPSHTESGTTFSSDRMTETGTYSAANSRPTAENTQYHNVIRSNSFSQSGDTSPGGANTATTNIKSTYNDDGNHTLGAAGTTDSGGYTLDVSTTLSTSSNSMGTYHDDVIGDGTQRQSQSASQTTDHFESGTYTNTNGTQTASGTIHEHTTGGAWADFTASGKVPGGWANWTSTSHASTTSDQTQDGPVMEAGGVKTKASVSFIAVQQTSGSTSYSVSSGTRGVDTPQGTYGDDMDSMPWLMSTPAMPWWTEPTLAGSPHASLPLPAVGVTAPVISSTAQVSHSFSSSQSSGGTITDNNGTSVTSGSFKNTQTITDTADRITSISGRYIPTNLSSTNQATFSASASASETDNSHGTNNAGVINNTYSNTGSESVSSSSTVTSDWKIGDDVRHEDGFQSQDELSSFTDTGTYTTSDPNGPPAMPTPDNPNGYASLSQHLILDDLSHQTITQRETDALGTPGPTSEYVATSATYAGSATATIHSDGTTTVNAAADTDDHTGAYSVKLTRDGSGGLIQGGQLFEPMGGNSPDWITITWAVVMGGGANQTITDTGNYGGPPGNVTKSGQAGNAFDWTMTTTVEGVATTASVHNSNTVNLSAPPASDGGQDTPEDDGGGWSTVLDVVQAGLDVAGFVPVLGEIPDGISGVISLARGDKVGAALSFASMIPFAGWGSGAAKIGRGILKHGDEAVSLTTKAVSKFNGVAGGVNKGLNKVGKTKGGIGPNILGQAGQKASKVVKNTEKIAAKSGKKLFRVPDGLDRVAKTLTEVKNVGYQYLSSQLKDSLAYAQKHGLQMILIVRKADRTRLSKPLREKIEAGLITLERSL